MSALGLDNLDDPRGALAYAPQRHRRPNDDSSIRPVLERLARSEGRVPGPRLMRKAPVQELPPPDIEFVAKSAVPMTARLAIAGAILALVAAAAAGYFVWPDEDQPAPASASAASPLPKPVQTLSIQRPDRADVQPAARLVKDDARMPEANAVVTTSGGALPQVAPAMPLQVSAPADPAASPLKAWATVAAGAAAPSWLRPVEAAADQAPPVADAAPAAPDASAKADTDPPAEKAAPAHQTRHAARHRSSHHRRSHAARSQAAAQAGAQATQQAETEPAQTQPVKKLPLQAAIDRIFGASGGASVAPPPQQ